MKVEFLKQLIPLLEKYDVLSIMPDRDEINDPFIRIDLPLPSYWSEDVRVWDDRAGAEVKPDGNPLDYYNGQRDLYIREGQLTEDETKLMYDNDVLWDLNVHCWRVN